MLLLSYVKERESAPSKTVTSIYNIVNYVSIITSFSSNSTEGVCFSWLRLWVSGVSSLARKPHPSRNRLSSHSPQAAAVAAECCCLALCCSWSCHHHCSVDSLLQRCLIAETKLSAAAILLFENCFHMQSAREFSSGQCHTRNTAKCGCQSLNSRKTACFSLPLPLNHLRT